MDYEKVRISIELGEEYPYDAPDWWLGATPGTELPPMNKSFAHRAARGIIADLEDRRGIKHGFENIDEDIRIDIIESIAAIILEAEGDRPPMTVWQMVDELWHRYLDWFLPTVHYWFCQWCYRGDS